MRLRWTGLLLGALVLGTGCSSGTDDVLKAWKASGQTPGAFTDAGAKLEGGTCREGSLSGLAALLCEFSDAEAATAAAEAGWALVGSDVGSSLASGKLVLVLSDPRKEDPSGRRLDSVIKTFEVAAR